MPERKEWTLMFYLASDNPLAPGVVSQLKAIKNAGFHPDANVITQFDPYVEGTPTHVFDVNLINKLKRPGIADVGFQGNDPFVRNLVEDKLWREQQTREGKPVKSELRRILQQNHGLDYEAGTPPDDRIASPYSRRDDEPEEPEPKDSLQRFLSFCVNKYPARHYALFILGHGVVVGNDVFLFDEHASRHALSLHELGAALREFKTEIDDAEFELVSFHSCSVSSIEVAYELQNTAKYMLASQGPAFVGSWPYRAIIIRIFNDLVRFGRNIEVKTMFERIFQYCFFNAVDFLLAGYSFQLTLLDLRKIRYVKEPVVKLVKALTEGLKDKDHGELFKDVIQLAHLKSQSFYQEMYTDVYDFCFCISNKLAELRKRRSHCIEHTIPPCTLPTVLNDLDAACQDVMEILRKEHPPKPNEKREHWIIVRAEFLGPSYQYSRGLSVYFPWTRPVGDRRIMTEYKRYKFHKEFDDCKQASWLDFLNSYFDATLRPTSSEEPDDRRYLPDLETKCPHEPKCPEYVKPEKPNPCAAPVKEPPPPPKPSPCQKEIEERELLEDIANLIYGEGPLLGSYELAGEKTSPRDPTGGSDCACPSIKNYPQDTRRRRKRLERAVDEPRVEVTQADFLRHIE